MWKDKINTCHWEFKIIFLSVIFAAFTVCFARTYHRYVLPVVQKTPDEFFVNNSGENSERISLKKGKITQTIRVDYNGLSAVGIRFERLGIGKKGDDTAKVLVQIFDAEGSGLLQEYQIPVQQIDNQKFEKILLEKELVGDAGHLYRIEIFLVGAEQVALYVSNENTYENGECSQNGKTLKGDIHFSLFGSSYQFIEGVYYIIGLLFIFCVMAALAYILFCKRLRLENIFLIGTLLFGTVYSIVLPPFAVPDESAHFVSAYHISDSILGKEKANQEELVQQDPYNNDGYFNRYPNRDTYRRVYNSLMSSEQDFLSYYDRQYDYIRKKSVVSGHAVQAVAIAAGRLLRLGYMPLVYFVRFVNLLFYSAIAYFAIRIMPFGKMFMLGVSLLPIVLEEAASVSYDGWIISFAFLYIAYCLHCIYRKNRITIRDTLLLLLFLFLCSNFKYIYYIMGGLLLLLPREKLEKKRQQYIIFGMLMVLFCVMAGKMMIESSQPITAEQLELINEKVAGFDRGQTYRMSELMRNPKLLFEIYINTIRDSSGEYLEQMLGQSLGSLNIPVNRIYIYILFMIMFVAALHGSGKERGVSRRQGIVFAMVSGGVAAAAMLAMLVAWTNVSDDVIIGIQGRYFLPVLPLLGLLISKLPIKLEKDISKKIVCSLFVVHYFVILDVFEFCMKLG